MMIKKLCLALLLFTEIVSYSQDYTMLHNKYWYYRTRLRNDFMKVGIGQGFSIPMEERGNGYEPKNFHYIFTNSPASGADAQWGDAMGELGYYLGILATEYHLLALNNQETDSVRYELYCALEALNRMDHWAETAYDIATTGPSYPPLYDGFMVRDDVQSDFVSNNMKHFNYFGNRGFCSKIKLNNVIGSSGIRATTSGLVWVKNYIDGVVVGGHWEQKYESSYISQDNWINCLVGLALVRKFLPGGVNYKNQSFSDGNPSEFSQESDSIALRVLRYFKRDANWLLKYPDHSFIGSNWGGVGTGLAFAHAEALNKMNQKKWGYYSFPDPWSFNNKCEFDNWLTSGGVIATVFKTIFVIPIISSNYNLSSHASGTLGNTFTSVPPIVFPSGEQVYKNTQLYFSPSANQDVTIQLLNVTAVGNCDYHMIGNNTKHAMQAHINRWDVYAPALIRMALHGFDNNNCSKTSFSQSYFDNSIGLISDAPCEGPFNWVAKNNGNIDYNDPLISSQSAYSNWHTQSQLDHPESRTSNLWIGEFNGIDYMFYHNLITICDIEQNGMTNTKQMVDFGQRHISTNYPIPVGGVLWGSPSKPATVKSFEYIVADNNVTSNTNVTYLAGKEITLRNGFSAINSNSFTAAIQQFVCNEIMSNPNDEGANYRAANTNGEDETSSQYPDLGATSYEQNQPTTLEEAASNNSNPNTGLVYVDDFVKTQNSLEGNVSASIAPNPNNGVSKLFITQPNLVKQIEVIDQLGKTLFTIETTSYTNDIDLSNYGKGVYSIILKGADGDVVVKKVVVQ